MFFHSKIHKLIEVIISVSGRFCNDAHVLCVKLILFDKIPEIISFVVKLYFLPCDLLTFLIHACMWYLLYPRQASSDLNPPW